MIHVNEKKRNWEKSFLFISIGIFFILFHVVYLWFSFQRRNEWKKRLNGRWGWSVDGKVSCFSFLFSNLKLRHSPSIVHSMNFLWQKIKEEEEIWSCSSFYSNSFTPPIYPSSSPPFLHLPPPSSFFLLPYPLSLSLLSLFFLIWFTPFMIVSSRHLTAITFTCPLESQAPTKSLSSLTFDKRDLIVKNIVSPNFSLSFSLTFYLCNHTFNIYFSIPFFCSSLFSFHISPWPLVKKFMLKLLTFKSFPPTPQIHINTHIYCLYLDHWSSHWISLLSLLDINLHNWPTNNYLPLNNKGNHYLHWSLIIKIHFLMDYFSFRFTIEMRPGKQLQFTQRHLNKDTDYFHR